MKDITIFSTRSFGKDYLFDDEHLFSPEEAIQDVLNGYFKIEKKNLEDVWWTVSSNQGALQDIENALKSNCSTDKEKKKLAYLFQQGKNANQKLSHSVVIDARNKIYEGYLVNSPDGAESFLSRYANISDYNGSDLQKSPARLYKLHDGVYAVHLLEARYEDKDGDKWIPALIKCAKIIAKEDAINVRLVLHDRDLCNRYIDDDVTIIPEEEVKKLAGEEMNGITSLRIVFFKHTSNAFALEILGKPWKMERDIHAEVDKWINNYSSLIPQHLQAIDGAPYKNNINFLAEIGGHYPEIVSEKNN